LHVAFVIFDVVFKTFFILWHNLLGLRSRGFLSLVEWNELLVRKRSLFIVYLLVLDKAVSLIEVRVSWNIGREV